jgi:hypothetical protein
MLSYVNLHKYINHTCVCVLKPTLPYTRVGQNNGNTKDTAHSSLLIFSRVGVTYKTGFRLDDWIYCTLYIHTLGTTGSTALSLFYTHLQFTIAHILGFSVFTNRILATDL